FIAWWPGTIAAGRTSDHIAYQGDFMATAAALAGRDIPNNIQSISMTPLLFDNDEPLSHKYLYWEFYESNPHQAVRMGEWKAIRKPIFSGEVELYNLSTDPGEENDVAD